MSSSRLCRRISSRKRAHKADRAAKAAKAAAVLVVRRRAFPEGSAAVAAVPVGVADAAAPRST